MDLAGGEKGSASTTTTTSGMEGHHRRALSWNCRRSGKISPANKEGGGAGGGGSGGGGSRGGAWWEWGRRSRSRASSPSREHQQQQQHDRSPSNATGASPSCLLQKSPSKDLSPKTIKDHHKTKGGGGTGGGGGGGGDLKLDPSHQGPKDDKSPTRSRPTSPLLSLSRPSSGGSSRPSSPCCPPLGPFISALAPHSGASSPLQGPTSPTNYRLDSVVFWSSALFSPPSLIIDLDVSC